MADDVCTSVCKNLELTKEIKNKMESLDDLNNLASLFKVLGDPTRIKILNALVHSELCVCDIAEIMNMGSSAVSHQLRVLRSSKLVKFRRQGKNVIYSLDDEHVYYLMKQGLEHIQE